MLRVMTAIIVFSTIATFAAGSDTRTESADYHVVGSHLDSSCGAFTPTSAPVCFSVRPGETRVTVSIEEKSPTARLGMALAGRMLFVGGHAPSTIFCDQGTAVVPEGATMLIVEVNTRGPRACEGIDPSPAVQGTVTATFT